MEKKGIVNIFRRNHPNLPETERLMVLWMEKAKNSVEDTEDSSIREIVIKSAQENLLTVKNLARWDTELDSDAIPAYSEWMDKILKWVNEESSSSLRSRRQAISEIAMADIYLSGGGVNPSYYDEAYECLLRAIEICGESSDLGLIAEEKIVAIDKVLNFLNENAKKPD